MKSLLQQIQKGVDHRGKESLFTPHDPYLAVSLWEELYLQQNQEFFRDLGKRMFERDHEEMKSGNSNSDFVSLDQFMIFFIAQLKVEPRASIARMYYLNRMSTEDIAQSLKLNFSAVENMRLTIQQYLQFTLGGIFRS